VIVLSLPCHTLEPVFPPSSPVPVSGDNDIFKLRPRVCFPLSHADCIKIKKRNIS
jgi:hypothetical protein